MKGNIKNKLKTIFFWSGMASATLVFAQSMAILLGYELPQDTIAKIMGAINSLLALLALFSGLLVNPEEVNSFQAMVTKMKKRLINKCSLYIENIFVAYICSLRISINIEMYYILTYVQ
jgi:uncharacterized membrane protein